MTSNVLSMLQADLPLQPLEAVENWDEIILQCKLKIAQRGRSAESQAADYALLGKAWVNKGNDAAAIAAYTESLKRSPHQSESHYALGILYARQKKPARAICHYQKAWQLRPDWVQPLSRLGGLFHRLGCSSRAYETYQHALSVNPQSAEAHVALGRIHEQRGEPRLAIKHYRQAAYLQPTQADARRGVGRMLTKVEAYEAAIDVYQQVLDELPQDAQTYSGLGQTLLTKGDTEAAIAAYQQALAIDNTLVAAHCNLGRLWHYHQDLEGATKCFKQALSYLPSSLPILNDYANVLAAKGDWMTLIDSFRSVVKQQPEWIANYCKRTVQLSDRDLLFRVQRTCGRFLIALQQADSDEVNAILKVRLGQIYEYMGDLSVACDAPGRAEQCYRSALAIAPYALNLYVRLGDCLKSQGRLSAACGIYQAGLLQSDQALAIEARAQTENLSASAMTAADWRSQLARRWQMLIQPSQPVSSEAVKSDAEPDDISQIATVPSTVSSSCVTGLYLTAEDWLADERLANRDLSDQDLTDQKLTEQGPTEQGPTDKGSTEQKRKEPLSSKTPSYSRRRLPISPGSARRPRPTHQCGGITCPICMSGLIQKFSPIQVGKRSFRCAFASDSISDLPRFTVTIPNGRAWVAPQKNAWDVCNEVAVLTSDGCLISDLSRAYPWYLPGCKHHQSADHSLIKRRTPLPKAKELSGKVAVLSGLSGHIYYHWMFDVLPRVAILEKSLTEQNQTLDDIDFFVVNNLTKAFQKETLQALGIPIEKVVASDLSPHIQAQHLVVPSFAGHLDWVPTRTLTFLRDTFLSSAVSQPQPAGFSETAQTFRIKNKRLYITRKRAKYRHIFNEAEVVDMLSQFGFVSVALETLSVAQQIALFSEAEAIVAPHGSGLTNLAFCSPETTVIECFSPNYVRTDYWMISDALNLNHYYLIGQGLECRPLRQLMYPSGLTEDFSIDVGELRSLLRSAGL